MKDAITHWEAVYSENAANEVSWYQTQPSTSLRLIEFTAKVMRRVLQGPCSR